MQGGELDTKVTSLHSWQGLLRGKEATPRQGHPSRPRVGLGRGLTLSMVEMKSKAAETMWKKMMKTRSTSMFAGHRGPKGHRQSPGRGVLLLLREREGEREKGGN